MNKTRRFIKTILNLLEVNSCKAEQKRFALSSSIKVGGCEGNLFTVPSGNQRHKHVFLYYAKL